MKKSNGKTKKANIKAEPRVEVVHIGDFQVDSASAIVGDPRFLDFEGLDKLLADGTDTVCAIARNGMGKAVAFQTGMGDGIYPVFAEYETDHSGRAIGRIVVDFTNPFRGRGCAKPYPHRYSLACLKGSNACVVCGKENAGDEATEATCSNRCAATLKRRALAVPGNVKGQAAVMVGGRDWS